ncbi:Competence protein PilN [Deinococcus marmoris]|uniref:Competence protein PilN n=1 Tax=Deinococcus marmoris TaxID=249408 RepID=A0A1U7NVU9_9DEIO|nr:Competence protein PilN [Deinococcus marmoris]
MVEINLLPAQYRRQSAPSAWRYATYALPIALVAAILIPEVVTSTRVGDLNRELDALNGDVAALAPAKQEFDTLTAEARTLEQVTSIAQQLRTGKTYWTNDLAAFTSQLPNDGSLAVNSMTIRNLDAGNLITLQQGGIYMGKAVTREIDLSGTATSQQAVVNFLKLYEDNPNFGVNFKSLQSDAQGGAALIGAGQNGAAGAKKRYTFTASVGIVGGPPVGTETPAVQSAPGAAPAPPAATPAAPPAQGAGSVN